MADAKTEKQKVKEITDKLEEGLKELFESGKYKMMFGIESFEKTTQKGENSQMNFPLIVKDRFYKRNPQSGSPLCTPDDVP